MREILFSARYSSRSSVRPCRFSILVMRFAWVRLGYAEAEELDVSDVLEVFYLGDAVFVQVQLFERREAFESFDLLDLVGGELDHLGSGFGREVFYLGEPAAPS